MKNCIVAQSGGPTAAINASLAGVIRGVKDSKIYDKIYGGIYGIQGVIEKHFKELSQLSDSEIAHISKSPAMYLGSCRYKLPGIDSDKAIYEKIFEIFDTMNIGAFFYIGGNDSMDTVDKLAKYAKQIGSDVKIAGVPKTIDNDLVMTDHTPGFGSAAKYIATTLREIAYDTYIYDIESVTIVEIMGRDAGWLTAASALARCDGSPAPHLIYLPEVAFDSEQFIEDLKKLLSIHKNVIVAVSEGIRDADGTYLSATSATADKFGHAQLSGAGRYLENLVKNNLDIKVRSVEINVLQRCASHLASAQDLKEGILLGESAVKFTEEGKSSFMASIKCDRTNGYSYEITDVPVIDVANKAKEVPVEWISKDKNDVTKDFIEYVTPLVQGEIELEFSNGLPVYPNIEHLAYTNNK